MAEGERTGLFRGHGPAVIAGLVFLFVVGTTVFFLATTDKNAPRQIHEFTMVRLVPPPPPPPPPPEQVQPKMIEQPKMVTPEEKSLAEQVQKNPAAKGPLGLDAKGDGAGDAFNLAGNQGGNGLLSGGGSRWGWYAGIVQQQVENALRANRKTRRAVFDVEVAVWIDTSGRVTRVKVRRSTGSRELDAAIENEVFAGMVVREAPPPDMPMPMVMRNSAHQSG
ncbi:TonB family protein [Rhizomicrobium palustre]|uniref:TonB family protein n=1 Tax=Rhizomicrobium palustre TaxID=189966 RepID=A0A846MZA8_9PROT|nr:energy transducer TonB [Rhizomicrobium palustre]NIK88958.1 TonB family protein [Rhizomicrobium palustre]